MKNAVDVIGDDDAGAFGWRPLGKNKFYFILFCTIWPSTRNGWMDTTHSADTLAMAVGIDSNEGDLGGEICADKIYEIM